MRSEQAVQAIAAQVEALRAEAPIVGITTKEAQDKATDFAARVRTIRERVTKMRDGIVRPIRERLAVLSTLWGAPIDALAKLERETLQSIADYIDVKKAQDAAEKQERERRDTAVHKGIADVFANVGMTPEQSEAATAKLMPRVDVMLGTGRKEEPLARTTTATVSTSAKTEFEVTDVNLLPDKFVTKTPNKKAILAALRAGETIPGVRSWEGSGVSMRVKGKE